MASKKEAVSPFMRHIEELYQMELENEHRTDVERTVTLNFPVEDACMLAAIAKRFGKSTASFGGEVFACHVRELFIALSPEDRRRIAAEADSECVAHLESKGIKRTFPDHDNGGQWARYSKFCDEVDAKENADE
jgi:hypothetical protein